MELQRRRTPTIEQTQKTKSLLQVSPWEESTHVEEEGSGSKTMRPKRKDRTNNGRCVKLEHGVEHHVKEVVQIRTKYMCDILLLTVGTYVMHSM